MPDMRIVNTIGLSHQEERSNGSCTTPDNLCRYGGVDLAQVFRFIP
jgi:hypothetical protein